MRNTLRLARIVALGCTWMPLATGGAAAQSVDWVRQFGTAEQDFPTAALADGADGMFVVGLSNADLGAPNKGPSDPVVARFDGAGQQVWLRQFGTPASEAARAAAPDAAGGLYLAGETAGALAGFNVGLDDAWVARIDANGAILWRRQLGSIEEDEAWAAAADGSGGVFLGGFTRANLAGPFAGFSDAWAARYDASGNLLWARQLGSAGQDFVNAVAPDGTGGAFFCGWTDGNLAGPHVGGSDAWVMHLDGDGNVLWSRQLGTGQSDVAIAAAADGVGGLYVGGRTDGNLGTGNGGAWLGRLDPTGATSWVRQYGESSTQLLCLASNRSSVFAAGSTLGTFGGPSAGQEDAWIGSFDGTGQLQWLTKIGSTAAEQPRAIVRGRTGGALVAGYTQGMLATPPFGKLDFWLARVSAP